jgi:hypothetical protein
MAPATTPERKSSLVPLKEKKSTVVAAERYLANLRESTPSTWELMSMQIAASAATRAPMCLFVN